MELHSLGQDNKFIGRSEIKNFCHKRMNSIKQASTLRNLP